MSARSFNRNTILLAAFFLACGICSSGCKREPVTASSTPAPAAPTDAAVIGKWKVDSVDVSKDIPADMADGIKRSLLTKTLTLGADHTFRTYNDAVGGFGGTWKLAGDTVTFTKGKDESDLILKSFKLTVSGPNLVDRDQTMTVAYARMPGNYDAAKYKMSVTDFLADLKNDPSLMKSKYAGQFVELDGYVGATALDLRPDCPVPLAQAAPTNFNSTNVVECYMIDHQPYAHIAPGEKVKVHGRIKATGPDATPEIIEASAVETGPATGIDLSAADLAAQYAKDAEAVRKTYSWGGSNGKLMLVHGPLLSVKEDSSHKPEGVVIGTPGAKVLCLFGIECMPSDIANLKPGDEVKIAGKYDHYAADENKCPTLSGSLMITEK